jgi:hypothetical protein
MDWPHQLLPLSGPFFLFISRTNADETFQVRGRGRSGCRACHGFLGFLILTPMMFVVSFQSSFLSLKNKELLNVKLQHQYKGVM